MWQHRIRVFQKVELSEIGSSRTCVVFACVYVRWVDCIIGSRQDKVTVPVWGYSFCCSNLESKKQWWTYSTSFTWQKWETSPSWVAVGESGIIRMDRNCLFWSFNGQKIDIYGAQFRRICLIPNINVFFCWFLFQISWMPSTILFWSKNPWLMKGFKAMRVLRIPRSQSHKALDLNLDQNSVMLTMTDRLGGL